MIQTESTTIILYSKLLNNNNNRCHCLRNKNPYQDVTTDEFPLQNLRARKGLNINLHYGSVILRFSPEGGMSFHPSNIDARIEEMRRRKKIAELVPDASRIYRARVGWPQWKLARCLATDKSVISAMENGIIKSWIVAEAVLILSEMPMDRLGIAETPGLRAKLDRFFREDIPINIEPSTDDELSGREIIG